MKDHARHRRARVALIAAATLAMAGPGLAQTIPEGQSCGGLVCDLGLFGHKTEKAAPQPVAPQPVAPRPVASQPTAAQPIAPGPARTAAGAEAPAARAASSRKKAHVARLSTKPANIAPAIPRTTATSTPSFGAPPVASTLSAVSAAPAAASVPVPAPVAAAAPVAPPTFAAVSAAPVAAPIPVTATPTRDEPVVLSNPYVYNKPLKFMFQSVDPTQGVE